MTTPNAVETDWDSLLTAVEFKEKEKRPSELAAVKVPAQAFAIIDKAHTDHATAIVPAPKGEEQAKGLKDTLSAAAYQRGKSTTIRIVANKDDKGNETFHLTVSVTERRGAKPKTKDGDTAKASDEASKGAEPAKAEAPKTEAPKAKGGAGNVTPIAQKPATRK